MAGFVNILPKIGLKQPNIFQSAFHYTTNNKTTQVPLKKIP